MKRINKIINILAVLLLTFACNSNDKKGLLSLDITNTKLNEVNNSATNICNVNSALNTFLEIVNDNEEESGNSKKKKNNELRTQQKELVKKELFDFYIKNQKEIEAYNKKFENLNEQDTKNDPVSKQLLKQKKEDEIKEKKFLKYIQTSTILEAKLNKIEDEYSTKLDKTKTKIALLKKKITLFEKKITSLEKSEKSKEKEIENLLEVSAKEAEKRKEKLHLKIEKELNSERYKTSNESLKAKIKLNEVEINKITSSYDNHNPESYQVRHDELLKEKASLLKQQKKLWKPKNKIICELKQLNKKDKNGKPYILNKHKAKIVQIKTEIGQIKNKIDQNRIKIEKINKKIESLTGNEEIGLKVHNSKLAIHKRLRRAKKDYFNNTDPLNAAFGVFRSPDIDISKNVISDYLEYIKKGIEEYSLKGRLNSHYLFKNKDYINDIKTIINIEKLDSILGDQLKRLDIKLENSWLGNLQTNIDGQDGNIKNELKRIIKYIIKYKKGRETFKPNLLENINNDRKKTYDYCVELLEEIKKVNCKALKAEIYGNKKSILQEFIDINTLKPFTYQVDDEEDNEEENNQNTKKIKSDLELIKIQKKLCDIYYNSQELDFNKIKDLFTEQNKNLYFELEKERTKNENEIFDKIQKELKQINEKEIEEIKNAPEKRKKEDKVEIDKKKKEINDINDKIIDKKRKLNNNNNIVQNNENLFQIDNEKKQNLQNQIDEINNEQEENIKKEIEKIQKEKEKERKEKAFEIYTKGIKNKGDNQSNQEEIDNNIEEINHSFNSQFLNIELISQIKDKLILSDYYKSKSEINIKYLTEDDDEEIIKLNERNEKNKKLNLLHSFKEFYEKKNNIKIKYDHLNNFFNKIFNYFQGYKYYNNEVYFYLLYKFYNPEIKLNELKFHEYAKSLNDLFKSQNLKNDILNLFIKIENPNNYDELALELNNLTENEIEEALNKINNLNLKQAILKDLENIKQNRYNNTLSDDQIEAFSKSINKSKILEEFKNNIEKQSNPIISEILEEYKNIKKIASSSKAKDFKLEFIKIKIKKIKKLINNLLILNTIKPIKPYMPSMNNGTYGSLLYNKLHENNDNTSISQTNIHNDFTNELSQDYYKDFNQFRYSLSKEQQKQLTEIINLLYEIFGDNLTKLEYIKILNEIYIPLNYKTIKARLIQIKEIKKSDSSSFLESDFIFNLTKGRKKLKSNKKFIANICSFINNKTPGINKKISNKSIKKLKDSIDDDAQVLSGDLTDDGKVILKKKQKFYFIKKHFDKSYKQAQIKKKIRKLENKLNKTYTTQNKNNRNLIQDNEYLLNESIQDIDNKLVKLISDKKELYPYLWLNKVNNDINKFLISNDRNAKKLIKQFGTYDISFMSELFNKNSKRGKLLIELNDLEKYIHDSCFLKFEDKDQELKKIQLSPKIKEYVFKNKSNRVRAQLLEHIKYINTKLKSNKDINDNIAFNKKLNKYRKQIGYKLIEGGTYNIQELADRVRFHILDDMNNTKYNENISELENIAFYFNKKLEKFEFTKNLDEVSNNIESLEKSINKQFEAETHLVNVINKKNKLQEEINKLGGIISNDNLISDKKYKEKIVFRAAYKFFTEVQKKFLALNKIDTTNSNFNINLKKIKNQDNILSTSLTSKATYKNLFKRISGNHEKILTEDKEEYLRILTENKLDRDNLKIDPKNLLETMQNIEKLRTEYFTKYLNTLKGNDFKEPEIEEVQVEGDNANVNVNDNELEIEVEENNDDKEEEDEEQQLSMLAQINDAEAENLVQFDREQNKNHNLIIGQKEYKSNPPQIKLEEFEYYNKQILDDKPNNDDQNNIENINDEDIFIITPKEENSNFHSSNINQEEEAEEEDDDDDNKNNVINAAAPDELDNFNNPDDEDNDDENIINDDNFIITTPQNLTIRRSMTNNINEEEMDEFDKLSALDDNDDEDNDNEEITIDHDNNNNNNNNQFNLELYHDNMNNINIPSGNNETNKLLNEEPRQDRTFYENVYEVLNKLITNNQKEFFNQNIIDDDNARRLHYLLTRSSSKHTNLKSRLERTKYTCKKIDKSTSTQKTSFFGLYNRTKDRYIFEILTKIYEEKNVKSQKIRITDLEKALKQEVNHYIDKKSSPIKHFKDYKMNKIINI